MENDSGKYIFIIGCARTGSKLHADILNASSDINLVDELHFLAPWWVRKDFSSHYRSAGNLQRNKNLERLVDRMYLGGFSGTFWKPAQDKNSGDPPQTIFDLDKTELLGRIKSSNRTLRDIFECLITMEAERHSKERPGAKFPVDIGSVDTLRSWFPDAKILHLIRDPRAIYASMVSMDKKYGFDVDGVLKSQDRSVKRLVYLISRFKKAAQVHKRFSSDRNYAAFSFENMITDPQKQIQRILNFLDVEYEEGMLQPRIRSSSFGNEQEVRSKGFDTNVMHRWKEHMPKRASQFLELVLAKEMDLFGYNS